MTVSEREEVINKVIPHCYCGTWCWDVAQRSLFNIRLPLPRHHPNCPLYELKTYKKVEYDGGSFVDTPENVEGMIPGMEGEEITISEIKMTEDQFLGLKEFQGF